MITVLSISVSVFAAYMAAIAAVFGVPTSISDSFYLWDGKLCVYGMVLCGSYIRYGNDV